MHKLGRDDAGWRPVKRSVAPLTGWWPAAASLILHAKTNKLFEVNTVYVYNSVLLPSTRLHPQGKGDPEGTLCVAPLSFIK